MALTLQVLSKCLVFKIVASIDFHFGNANSIAQEASVLKVAFTRTCQRLYKTAKSLGWNGNVEKKWNSEFRETTGETTYKTHTGARKMMKL